MEKLKPYFIDLKCTIGLVSFLLSSLMSYGQGNCLLYPENSGERKACELSYKAIEYPQGSAASQMLFDSAISIGPRYAYAYYQKSVPYFKHGLLSEGIQLLNKAIELDPRSYLCYRAYWYFSHLSYAHCIADLERYYSAMEGQMAFTPGGDMEMRLLLAVSYAKTGDLDRGINTILQCIGSYELESHIGLYDHYILGVLYYENGDMQKAAEALENQIDHRKDKLILVEPYLQHLWLSV